MGASLAGEEEMMVYAWTINGGLHTCTYIHTYTNTNTLVCLHHLSRAKKSKLLLIIPWVTY